MSKARAELQRQVNDCRVRNEFLKGEVKNLKLEKILLLVEMLSLVKIHQ